MRYRRAVAKLRALAEMCSHTTRHPFDEPLLHEACVFGEELPDPRAGAILVPRWSRRVRVPRPGRAATHRPAEDHGRSDRAARADRRRAATALARLRAAHGSYWERDWRREHRGNGRYPEHHLWDTVHSYLDLLDVHRNQDTSA